MNYVIICFISSQMLTFVYGQTYNEMDHLLGHLFNESRYNKFLRPLHNQSHVMKVNFTQHLSSIEYFDISSGELLISGFFEITWTDELLAWNPSMYGGKDMIPLPKGAFWKPELALTNEAANDKSSIDSNGFSPAWATSQGSVIMVPAGSYKTRCNVDTSLYPFDIHTCSFQFIVSNHDTTELMLYSPTGNLDIGNLIENGEWLVENTKAIIKPVSDENFRLSVPMSEASFSLKRRPAFEMINNYTPVILMTVLNLFTCFVRPDSGERLSFAVTLYLSLVFATTALVETIPSNSLKIPHMSFVIFIINFLNTASVLWNIFIVNLSRKANVGHPFPAFITKIVVQKRKRDGKKPNKIKPDDRSATNIVSVGSEETTNEKNGDRIHETRYVTDFTGEEVAEVLDRIFFLVALLLFFLIISIYSILLAIVWNKT